MLSKTLAVLLCLFTVSEVNYPLLTPQGQLAVFSMLALVLCFLHHPVHPKLRDNRALLGLDKVLALASVACCAFIVVQTEPSIQQL